MLNVVGGLITEESGVDPGGFDLTESHKGECADGRKAILELHIVMNYYMMAIDIHI